MVIVNHDESASYSLRREMKAIRCRLDLRVVDMADVSAEAACGSSAAWCSGCRRRGMQRSAGA
jgi:hypothetical protein